MFYLVLAGHCCGIGNQHSSRTSKEQMSNLTAIKHHSVAAINILADPRHHMQLQSHEDGDFPAEQKRLFLEIWCPFVGVLIIRALPFWGLR